MSMESERDFLRDIVTGIKWIHKNKIIHRDIHGGNILINNLKSNGSDSKTLIADLRFGRPPKDDFRYLRFRMIMWELNGGYCPFYDRPYDSHLALDELRSNIT
ncbi:17671_t:CDS:2 [Cetraspora pellucida]|uniref:17671_t:CDS:1 n=1 Tax=Cetraspora pellucida TaxID=1433469 RepID=A0A9N9C2F3_9GLOM|nr:17671_t:CDS:2 [Cetraspora pellucida]